MQESLERSGPGGDVGEVGARVIRDVDCAQPAHEVGRGQAADPSDLRANALASRTA